MRTRRPAATPVARRPFSGWRIVGFASVTYAMTAPGQTIGVSVFVDPMIGALEITRSQVSGAYLVGTLAGGAAMPFVGPAIDRFGVRRVMTVVGAGFAVALASMGGVGGLVPLVAGFAGIRMLGQGSLSLTSTTAVALWFERRRGFAMALTTSAGVGAMSFAPVGLAALIDAVGWRTAWVVAGVGVLAIVLPIARLGMQDSPESVGQHPDGDAPPTAEETARRDRASWTRPEALRTLLFWAIAGATAANGLVGTAVTFHAISLLGEQGLSSAEAAATFVPLTAAVIASTLGTGWLVDRMSPKLLAAGSMAVLAASLVLAQTAAPGPRAAAYAVALGAAMGSARAVEAGAMPRYFGVRHIGSIRGAVMALIVASTAMGPYLLALGHERFGGYAEALTAMLVIPAAIVVLLALARPPERARG